jgi:hypothetical protein
METEKDLSELILIADHLSDEGNHNWAFSVGFARSKLVAQSAEIERLKGLLREAADDISHWSSYAPEYFVEKYKAEDDIQKYREAGEVTK